MLRVKALKACMKRNFYHTPLIYPSLHIVLFKDNRLIHMLESAYMQQCNVEKSPLSRPCYEITF